MNCDGSQASFTSATADITSCQDVKLAGHVGLVLGDHLIMLKKHFVMHKSHFPGHPLRGDAAGGGGAGGSGGDGAGAGTLGGPQLARVDVFEGAHVVDVPGKSQLRANQIIIRKQSNLNRGMQKEGTLLQATNNKKNRFVF